VEQPNKSGVSICASITSNGKRCRRPVHPGAKACWQHSTGLAPKWQSLTRNQTILFICALIGVIIGVIDAGITVLAWVYPLDPNRMEGVLLPGNDPDPVGPPGCVGPSDAVKISLGSSLSFVSRFPFKAITLGNSHVLTINKSGDRLLIDAIVTDSDGRLIADIRHNQFAVNPNNIFRREIPNKSTLRVIDQYNRQALYVRYLNSHAVKILGTFTEPVTPGPRLDVGRFTVAEDEILVSGWGMVEVTLGSDCAHDLLGMYSLWGDPNDRGYIFKSRRPQKPTRP
jgi:hypothetical protein